jgi:hypothetical protein
MSNKDINSQLESPWLTPLEAAEYCKVSLSFFNQKRKELPMKVGGSKRRPRFHVSELDYWMEKGFENFSHIQKSMKRFKYGSLS